MQWLAGLCAAAAIAEWRQFHGAAARTGFVDAPGPTSNRTQQVLKLGTGSTSMAVVGSDGTMYIPTMHQLGEIKAFTAAGALKWRYQLWPSHTSSYSMRFDSPPALSIDGSVLYAANADSLIVALDTATGTQLWNVTTCINGKIPSRCGEILGQILLNDLQGELFFGATARQILALST